MILFLFFFTFYLTINVFLILSTNSNVFDYFFQSDSPRVMSDMIMVYGDHYRFYVHPLFVIIVQPIMLLLNGIIHNNLLTIILFQSLIGGLQVLLMHYILDVYSDNKKVNIVISIMFGFAFSTIIFNSIIELYNIASLSMLLLWFVTSIMIKKEKYDKKMMNFLFIISGILCIGITITNYIIVLIASLILLLFRKQSTGSLILKNAIIIVATLLLLCIEIFCWNIPYKGGELRNETTAGWVNTQISVQKIKNVVSDDLYNSVLSSSVTTKKNNDAAILTFNKTRMTNIVIMTSFYIIVLFLLIINFKKNMHINIALVLSILFNSTFHLIYGNNDCFLYSNHFTYLVFLMLGINIGTINNKKMNKLLLLIMYVFLGILISINLLHIKTVIDITKSIFSITNFGKIYCCFKLLFSIGITAILVLEINFLVYSLKKQNVYNYIIALFSLLLLSVFFVFIDVSLERRTFEKFSPNTIVNKEKMIKKFNEHFYDEICKYYEYVDEFQEIRNVYNNELVNYDGDFYLFGFNDREKIIYKNGKLLNAFSGEVIEQYDVREQLIIPNIFTVIIRTTNDDYIKIYENNDGVFINDTVISNTDKKIELYKFENEKYNNILNTLYGEILFNIKDGVIYPNILVYDKPWYRDAAMGTMVLEYTNNTDLIKEWVNSIDDVYDKQNGNDEPDNLGELLYLLSFGNNKKLKKKIVKEAERLAKSNPDGYHIYGIVDGSRMDNYANKWLEFGYLKNDLKYEFDKNIKKDGYTDMLWFFEGCSGKENAYSKSKDYPYLTWATGHCNKDLKVYFNQNLYPLSWEANASKANYNNINSNLDYYINNKISPTHVWAASEMFLNIIDRS